MISNILLVCSLAVYAKQYAHTLFRLRSVLISPPLFWAGDTYIPFVLSISQWSISTHKNTHTALLRKILLTAVSPLVCLSVCFHTACFCQILKVKSVNSVPPASPNKTVKIINKFKHSPHPPLVTQTHKCLAISSPNKQSNSLWFTANHNHDAWRISILLHRHCNPVFHYTNQMWM